MCKELTEEQKEELFQKITFRTWLEYGLRHELLTLDLIEKSVQRPEHSGLTECRTSHEIVRNDSPHASAPPDSVRVEIQHDSDTTAYEISTKNEAPKTPWPPSKRDHSTLAQEEKREPASPEQTQHQTSKPPEHDTLKSFNLPEPPKPR